MKLFCLCYLALISGFAEAVQAQQTNSVSQHVYDSTSYKNDSSHIQSTFRVGGSLAAQYNNSRDAPLSVGSNVYGSNGDNADFNLFPEVSLDADGILAEYFRYRFQFAYADYGFDWSDGIPAFFGNPAQYYRNSAQALVFRIAAGIQAGSTYLLFGSGYGTYLSAGHGIGASPAPPLLKSEVLSSLVRWEFTLGEDIPLSNHKIYLSPEIFCSINSPTNQPIVNFIPNTLSLGVRLNLQWALFAHYRQSEVQEEFIYAYGRILDCKTSQPITAQVSVIDVQSGKLVESRSTDSSGQYEFHLLQGNPYRFIINKPGYFSDSVSLTANSAQNIELPTILLCSSRLERIEDSSIHVEGNVSACNTQREVHSIVRFIDPSTNVVVSEIRTDASGNYQTNIPNAGRYKVQVDAEGYFPYDETVDLSLSNRDKSVPFRIKNILVCDSVNLQSNFDFDSYSLRGDATPYVDRIAEYLKNNPTITVSIEGHTDNIGLRSHNMKLSENRANALKEYLLTKGVREDQIISVTWFGPDKPIGDNQTEEGRQRNRRVDLKEVDRKEH